MRGKIRVFALLVSLLLLGVGIYGWRSGSLLSAVSGAACVGFFLVAARRGPRKPRARRGPSLLRRHDRAGEVKRSAWASDAGTFERIGRVRSANPVGYWRLATVLAVAFAAVGITLWVPWLVAVGVVALLLTMGWVVLAVRRLRRDRRR